MQQRSGPPPQPGPAGLGPPGPCLGLDVGGTKIEALLLDAQGQACWRQRVASPSSDYGQMLQALVGLVGQGRAAARAAGLTGLSAPAGPAGLAGWPSVGLGIPGTALADGRIKNANTQCLNGRTLAADLQQQLGQPVQLANDANCLALSEATDGAGAGAAVVFAAILGTGTGAGIAVHGRVLTGPNGVAGEWGHNPMPWAPADEPRPPCYCGQAGCIETLLSGPALAADHARSGQPLCTAVQVAQAAEAGDPAACATLAHWHQRLARALASVINLLDPDVVVLGGGLSRIASTYSVVPSLWGQWVVSGGLPTPVRTLLRPAAHGDASGVRGAAWLGRQR